MRLFRWSMSHLFRSGVNDVAELFRLLAVAAEVDIRGVVIVDDGSSDDTCVTIRDFLARTPARRACSRRRRARARRAADRALRARGRP